MPRKSTSNARKQARERARQSLAANPPPERRMEVIGSVAQEHMANPGGASETGGVAVAASWVNNRAVDGSRRSPKTLRFGQMLWIGAHLWAPDLFCAPPLHWAALCGAIFVHITYWLRT